MMTPVSCRARHLKRLANIAIAILAAATPIATMAADPVRIDYEKFKLDNGLTVIVHTDRKAPIVAVNLWYHVGSKDERPGKTGFAHLFEHLMFQGTRTLQGRVLRAARGSWRDRA